VSFPNKGTAGNPPPPFRRSLHALHPNQSPATLLSSIQLDAFFFLGLEVLFSPGQRCYSGQKKYLPLRAGSGLPPGFPRLLGSFLSVTVLRKMSKTLSFRKVGGSFTFSG